MGAIWLSLEQLYQGLSELVGYKLGLSITESELHEALLSSPLSGELPSDREIVFRIRSEDYEDLATTVLSYFGDPDAVSGRRPPVMSVLGKIDEADRAIATEILTFVIGKLSDVKQLTSAEGKIDPTPILEAVIDKWDVFGQKVALQLFAELNAQVLISPWSTARGRNWPDLLALHNLFASEEDTATIGAFFDQRFIDYLQANFNDIDQINWRNFESLIGEFLDRSGLHVQMGPGRGDDGIDIRAWIDDVKSPATIIVQCKRERRKITKTVLKALASDVAWEGAQVGLLATTSSWSPGARATAESRAYPIEEVNRTVIRAWISKMRTPGEGLWLPN